MKYILKRVIGHDESTVRGGYTTRTGKFICEVIDAKTGNTIKMKLSAEQVEDGGVDDEA